MGGARVSEFKGGYTGKFLRIDLTGSRIRMPPPVLATRKPRVTSPPTGTTP